MRIPSLLLLVVFITFSCSENDSPENDYTGRTISYELYAGNDAGIPGTVNFKERLDKSVDIIITLDELDGEGMLPAHLHFGDLSESDNPQAALLNSYDVEKGISITNFSQLADDTTFPFERIEGFNGSVKVHLGQTGDDYNVIVAAGNIGTNESLGFNLESIATCSPDLAK